MSQEVEHAAEIAMEHRFRASRGMHLVSCRAVNAARMAMNGSGERKVSLDRVVRTRYETGQAMQARLQRGFLSLASQLTLLNVEQSAAVLLQSWVSKTISFW